MKWRNEQKGKQFGGKMTIYKGKQFGGKMTIYYGNEYVFHPWSLTRQNLACNFWQLGLSLIKYLDAFAEPVLLKNTSF